MYEMLFFAAAVLLLGATVRSANILAIISFPSYSHQLPLLTACKALASRGHNLTVITTDPPKERIENFTVIDVSSSYQMAKAHEKQGFSFQKEPSIFELISMMGLLYVLLCDYQLSLPQVKEFIRVANNTEYDLVITQNLIFSSFFGLIHKISSPPVVAISTLTRFSPSDLAMGVPPNPSYIPELLLGYSDEMGFFERVHNSIMYWWMKGYFAFYYYPYQEELLKKHFGYDFPSAREMEYNKSLVLLTADQTLDYAVPQPPNVISIGPIHISPSKALPEDLQKWMDEAEDGVVYLSFGSNKKFSGLQDEKRNAFVQAFAQFPSVKFLCKWEIDDDLPGASGNILTRKWFPQQDVLGHSKLKAVIFQGGIQSAQEILYQGVPMIGIPFLGDQRRNVRKLVVEGAAVVVQSNDVTYNTIYDAMKKVLYDKSYKENAMRLSRIMLDRIRSGREEAVWWMEYVIRHKGAKHLRPGSMKLDWYQLNLVDVYAFLLGVILLVVYTLYWSIKLIVRSFIGQSKNTSKVKTK